MTDGSLVALPVASYSEYDGTIVNEDNILQSFNKVVCKNEEPKDILEITLLLGGAIHNARQAWPGIKTSVPLLADIQQDQIPAEGLQLTESEEAHVSA
jgi:NADH-quinone oxidoreductase subunit G